jgi:hypothetical protein
MSARVKEERTRVPSHPRLDGEIDPLHRGDLDLAAGRFQSPVSSAAETGGKRSAAFGPAELSFSLRCTSPIAGSPCRNEY